MKNSLPRKILFEGYTNDQILKFSSKKLKKFIFSNEPIVFKAGSSEILGEFRVTSKKLIVELAQIEGGGEGVLPSLWVLAEQYAKKQDLDEVEWIVHAVNCATPNLKLKRILEKRGFQVREIEEIGKDYHFLLELK